jgi:hypothetical protein
VEGYSEHGDEPSGSIKCWEVLEYLQNGRLIKKGLVSEFPPLKTLRPQQSCKFCSGKYISL